MTEVAAPVNNITQPTEDPTQLTINQDVAADLDSTNAFEGPEKLLEVWFAPSAGALPPSVKPNGLKSVAASIWEPMLDEVHCKVLSVIESEHVDAYLLSESSMFVFPHKLILKTCGTTTLLRGLPSLLRIAAIHAGFPFHNVKSLEDEHVAATPYRVFYSRKNFLYPEKQPTPHSSWSEEVKFLDDTFANGRAYMVGRMNGDHWYLYIISPETMLTPPRTPDGTPAGQVGPYRVPTGLASAFRGAPESNDETLEILMTDLDLEKAKQFYMDRIPHQGNTVLPEQTQTIHQETMGFQGDMSESTATLMSTSTNESVHEDTFDDASMTDAVNSGLHTPMSENPDLAVMTTEGHALGAVVSKACGLSDVYPVSKYPDARIDAYMFNPCGFSANGVVPASHQTDQDAATKSTHYFTVHVTPEPQCSYASFETNMPGGQNGRETSDIIEQVVAIFKPGRFSVTLFEAQNDELDIPKRKKRVKNISGYRRIDRIVHDFDDYDLVFQYFEREGWDGGNGVRVGEV